ncbi:head-tail adaptor protein [Aquamicrobium soli]|uniref:Head-tail adaptor protein n=1 Tax=Aquamicrobium soli TaxID=1811518 RepID=A0ABV7KBD2_9HYPH
MAAKRPAAGQLRSRVTFQRRGDAIDPFDGSVIPGGGDWVDQYTCAARLQPLFGSRLSVEDVAAARLAARQPYNLTIRSCAAARAIRTDWRVVDARTATDANGASPRVFNIKTVVDPLENGAWLEMLCIESEAS